MKAESLPFCSHCGSGNVLPFEDDSHTGGDTTLFIAMLAAVLVLCGYLLFVVTSYLYYPVVVFIAIIATTKLINKHQEERKQVQLRREADYMCLDCGGFFRK
ncbi:MAG: hypothetical protein GY940_15145 [bacterium]|nr:hypothetical protein [bacterium]